MFDTIPNHGRQIEEVESMMRRALGHGRAASLCALHLEAGGARVRAHLALRAGAAAGLDDMTACAIAAGCELLHNASLVHDDLQDRDAVRRDAPALWVKGGDAAALCAGDLMISAAFSALAAAGTKPSDMIADAHQAIAETIRGQLSRADDWASYADAAEAKSGPLIALPVVLVMRAVCLPRIETAKKAGHALALAYQIADDIEDRDADRKARTPNACLVLERVNHRPGVAIVEAQRRATVALAEARRSASVLPSQVGTAFLELARQVETAILEKSNAA